MTSKINRLAIAAQARIRDAKDDLQARSTALRAQSEAGIENIPWTAIIAIGSGVLALAVLGILTAWVTGYFNTKLGGF